MSEWISHLADAAIWAVLVGGLVASAGGPGEAQVERVELALEGSQGRAQVRRYEEDASHVSFAVEAEGTVRLTVRPEQFVVRAGEQYSINTSYYAPFFARADADGELRLRFEEPRNCTVVIEESRGGNLAENGSFETVGAAASAWGYAAEVTPATAKGGVEVSQSQARTGRSSARLVVGEDRPGVVMRAQNGVPVEPGTSYLVSAYYRLEGARHGSSLSFFAEVRAPNKESIWVGDSFLYPLILEDPAGWRRMFFTVAVPQDYEGAELRPAVSASGTPFTAYIDDLEVRTAPLAAPQYTVVLTEAETRPRYSAEEVERLMAAREPVRVEPPVVGERPLLVNGRPVNLFAYASHPDPMDWPVLSDHKRLLGAGIQMHFIPALSVGGWHGEEPLWVADGVYDFSPIRRKLATILGHDPDACVLLYLGLEPYPAFGDVHPEARWVNAEGAWSIGEKEGWRPATERKPREAWNISYTAEAYRRETAAFLRALGRFLATDNLGKAVVGVNLAGGTDGQWFVPGWGGEFGQFDRSEGALAAFREWLRSRYGGDVEALRRAWKDGEVTFETAAMPEEVERSPDRYFLEARSGEDGAVIDANLFEQVGVAESINLFGRAFKEGIGRPALVFTYYPKKHYALRTLLADSGVDGIVGVMEYGHWRPLGRTGHNDSAPGSLRLHNKIFLTEMDFRTEYADTWGSDANAYRQSTYMTRTPEEAANQVRRDLGNALCQFQGGWLYGLPGNDWIGPKHFAYIENGAKAAIWAATEPQGDDIGQLAVFMDERIRAYGSERHIWGSVMHYMANYIPRMTLNRSGLSWDDYLLTDLGHPKLPRYRMYLFATAGTITPEQIGWVKENLQKDGNVLIFVNAAGWSLGEGFERNIRDLTGMTVRAELDTHSSQALTPVGEDRLAEGAGDLLSGYSGPTFFVDDPEATAVAVLSGTDKVGLAVKRFPEWTSVYISVLGGFTPRLLRNLAEEAGIVPIGPEDDVTYAGNGFMVLHALKAGEKTLRWSGTSDLFDLTSGETVARGAESYTFRMEAMETRWFRRMPSE